MHYSSIEEVWGTSNFIEKMDEVKPEPVQPIIPQELKQPTQSTQQIIKPVNDINFDLSETTIDEEECKILIQKIMKSKKCKKYLRNKFRPKILEKLEDIIDEYRDLIVLILICYAIYLFVSIINDA
jgi:hypothetical protein